MGVFTSRFQKNERLEVLEKLENEIKEIEESKSYAETRRKQITKILHLYSLAICIIFGIVFYFCYSSPFEKYLMYLVLLAVFPLVIVLINKIISWYYLKQINKSQSRLIEMKKEKKRILDEVMNKETYNVAKEILDKFSNDVPKTTELRKRISDVSRSSPTQHQTGLMKTSFEVQNNKITNLNPAVSNSLIRMPRPGPGPGPGPGFRPRPTMSLPAPILPLERSYVNKMIEYLIGDGPNNRFALICSKCHSHNGMALKEEFEYLSYKCCYCFSYNPARKIRPQAPKLKESQFPQIENHNYESDSNTISSEENSEEIIDKKQNVDEISTDLVKEENNSNKIDDEPQNAEENGERKEKNVQKSGNLLEAGESKVTKKLHDDENVTN